MSIEKGSVGEEPVEKKEQEPTEIDVMRDEINRLREEMKNVNEIAKASGVRTPETATAKEIAQAIVEANDEKKTGFKKPEHIDPDDILDPPINFVSHKVMYGIFDDKRFGAPVKPPVNEKILFGYSSTKIEKIGRETFIKPFCNYLCRSKKEAAWLRIHTMYGIEFFDSMKSMITSDMRRAAIAANYVRSMEMQSKDAILGHARRLGIPLGQDLSELRTLVALKLADVAISEDDKRKKDDFESLTKEQMMTKE